MTTPDGGVTESEAEVISEVKAKTISLATVKAWLNNHKTTPSATSELEGTKTIRANNFADYIKAFIGDALSGTLPDEMKEALGTLGENISGTLEGVPIVGDTISGAFDTAKNFLANPFESLIESSETMWSKIIVTAGDYQNTLLGIAEGTVSPETLTFFESLQGETAILVRDAMTNLGSWGDSLADIGPTGYTLRDAFDLTSEGLNKATSYMGLPNFTISQLAGTLTNEQLHREMTDSLNALDKAQNADLTDANNLADAEAARLRVNAAAQAIIDQQASDQENFNTAIANSNAAQTHFDMANYYSSLTPEQQALYTQTLTPGTAGSVTQLSTALTNNLNTTPATVTPESITAPSVPT